MKTPIHPTLKHLLVSELMSNMFYRQHYFGKIVHQLGYSKFVTVESALIDKLREKRTK